MTPPDAIRCFDHKCRKRLPAVGLRFCPYCGMPVIQNWLPPRYIVQRIAVVLILGGLCMGVYSFLGYSITQLEAALATVTPTAIPSQPPPPTATPTPTRDRFAFRFEQTPTPTTTPIPAPTDVQLILVEPTAPTTIGGVINDPFRLFEQPNYNATMLYEFPDGAELDIIGAEPNRAWLKVRLIGFDGWVNAQLVNLPAPWTLETLPLVDVE